MPRRIVVIGGGAAGMSAASAARRADSTAEVTVWEQGPFPSYGVCGLPYYLGGVISDPESLIAYPAAEFRERRRIDLRLDSVITSVDLEAHLVVDSDGAEWGYDALVYAAGAQPIVPSIPGVDDPRVMTVRRLEDAIELRARLGTARRGVIVGAGYVGLEMAEALHACGLDVTVMDRLSRVMTTVDPDVAAIIQTETERHCTLLLDAELRALHSHDSHIDVEYDGGTIPTDVVVLAVGVSPSTGLVSDLAALPNGALIVDEQMRTSAEDVYAAGDCIAVHHRVLGEPAFVPLGPAANKTGRVAGTVAGGGEATFAGVVGTAVVKVFDLTVAHTGVTLEEARARGWRAEATQVTAKSRAKYYPGAEPIIVRLVHKPDGRVIGAQLVGRDGVAQRINVVAAALQVGMTVDDIAELDLAYAPPYSPVYDPLIQAAQAAVLARGRG
ncbi:MAG: FAD-dependent oxidoreductase [Candidatus Nanopelagicales bacterium]|nr:FAD-dependent oxidoreductase [Candidatus Nanopelagicales bacterium]MDP4714350.1 FAD-dependent oxidoreductase [Candidatus Nanopelagicales bacterium]MDP4975441.1 FAD-dependent oxidoreductase [Candidatus Nanopelagicales bacterium]MDP5094670.1 FAD-dependent oxidoreductase [Candidatus Nanopelagicales bacterium]